MGVCYGLEQIPPGVFHPTSGADVTSEIDQNGFAARLAQGNAFVLDVREAREYRPGHVPGARNLPLSVLPARMAEVPKDRPVYVVCQAGGRSAQAVVLLRAVGVDAVDVLGGTGAWIDSGRPIETTKA
ncbi:rhodanese-like domain-containing protein [Lentzea sp. PSKA42]|uniref:Rhodanese-like domain-containing protein n=1 Tax=Lentzea indica TaxID=2604800 RepID=A0ABX1FM19_9PSEU|nr:rhodanese-like domain-containing protein [Lentzea indica]